MGAPTNEEIDEMNFKVLVQLLRHTSDLTVQLAKCLEQNIEPPKHLKQSVKIWSLVLWNIIRETERE